MVRNISICMKLYMKSKLRLGHRASQVFGHPDILLRISSAGGKVASHHNAVQAASQSIGLQAPEVHFPAAGGADERLRQDKAEHGEGAEHFQRRQAAVRIERRAFHRIQNIHGDGIDVHGLQFEGHFHPLVQGFAQADDAAGAYPDACLLGGADVDFLVLHAVGGAHFRE